MLSYAASKLGDIDTTEGTVLREGVMAPVASELEKAYSRTDEVERNQTIANPSAISDSAMDAIAANFGRFRFLGSKSIGTLRFFRYLAPIVPIQLPAGTTASAGSASDSLEFETLASASLSSLSSQDPISGAYYIDIPSSCVQFGSASNVNQDTIQYQSVAGIDGVTNITAFTGGKDKQTNDELASLIISTAQGNQATKSGYESLVRSNYSVDDMAIIGPTDPEAMRAQFGGSVDIILLSSQSTESSETFPSSMTAFIPTFLPLYGVSEIRGIEDVTNDEKTLVQSTDYTVNLDIFTYVGRSMFEGSSVGLHVTSFVPKPGSMMTIKYTNGELIRVVQSFLDSEPNNVIGSDVMVKAAIEIGAIVECDIHIIPGYDATLTATQVQQNVEAYLDARMLDDDVQASDIITTIGNTEGVDSVDLGTFFLARADNPFVNIPEILANKKDYIRPSSVTVNVVG